jgi:hypothetical protein
MAMTQKRFTTVVVASMLVLVTATAAIAKTYSSKKGYTIAAPAGWKVDSSGLMGTDLVLMAKPQNGFAANLNVVVTAASPGQTLAQGHSYITQTYPRLFNNYKKLAQGNTTIGGVPAISVTATHSMGTPPRTLRMHQVIAIRRGSIYTFTCTAANADYAKFDAAFKSALKSVKWKK